MGYIDYDTFKQCGAFAVFKAEYLRWSFSKVNDHKIKFMFNGISNSDLIQNMAVYFGAFNLNEAYKEIQSVSSKLKRITDKINYIFSLPTKFKYFVTLTLDETNINLKMSTYRKYIARVFNDCSYYIFNTDYGSLHNRLHFHCIVATDSSIKAYKSLWSLGYSDYEIIKVYNDKAMTKYLYKLRNHAVKDSTHNERLITPSKKIKKTF